jgi:two-component system invasion response regulator UvrY
MNSSILSSSKKEANDRASVKNETESFLTVHLKDRVDYAARSSAAGNHVFRQSSYPETGFTEAANPGILDVLIVGNEPLAVLSLEKIILDIQPYSRLSQSVSVLEAIELMVFAKPSLLIVDITNNEAVSLSLIKSILRKNPKVKILIISDVDENIFAIPYFHAGAQGFISKYASAEDFKRAIATLINQQKYFSESVLQTIIKKSLSDKKWNSNPLTSLSVRENQVLNFLTERRSSKEIAVVLGVKSNTIGTYKRRIYSKLKVSNLRELLEKVKLLK